MLAEYGYSWLFLDTIHNWNGKGPHMRGPGSISCHDFQVRMEKSDFTVKIQGMTCACGRWREQADYKSEKAWPLGKSYFPLGSNCSHSALDIFFPGAKMCFENFLGSLVFFSLPLLQPSYHFVAPLWQASPYTQWGTVEDIYSARANQFRWNCRWLRYSLL